MKLREFLESHAGETVQMMTPDDTFHLPDSSDLDITFDPDWINEEVEDHDPGSLLMQECVTMCDNLGHVTWVTVEWEPTVEELETALARARMGHPINSDGYEELCGCPECAAERRAMQDERYAQDAEYERSTGG